MEQHRSTCVKGEFHSLEPAETDHKWFKKSPIMSEAVPAFRGKNSADLAPKATTGKILSRQNKSVLLA
jgi:hypothetical protein